MVQSPDVDVALKEKNEVQIMYVYGKEESKRLIGVSLFITEISFSSSSKTWFPER